MSKRPSYRIECSPDAEDHLALLTARQSTTVLDTIIRQLGHEPTIETRNRKPLRPNPVAGFKLRIGEVRVYDDVEEVPARIVIVKAVALKDRDRVFVGGREIKL
jgi:mRNA-degrading endonuclease RelE of RelBE toxin-antitoxin system